MPKQERVLLTAASDCTTCQGSGVMMAFVATGPARFGGKSRDGARVRVMCTCVRAWTLAPKGAADE